MGPLAFIVKCGRYLKNIPKCSLYISTWERTERAARTVKTDGQKVEDSRQDLPSIYFWHRWVNINLSLSRSLSLSLSLLGRHEKYFTCCHHEKNCLWHNCYQLFKKTFQFYFKESIKIFFDQYWFILFDL